MNINFDTKVFSISITELARLMTTSMTIPKQQPREESHLIHDDSNDQKRDERTTLHGTARAWLGTEQHRKIKEALRAINIGATEDDIEQEAYLKYQLEIKNWHITIRGRIDVVVKNPTVNSYQIIELKTVLGTNEPEPVILDFYRTQVLLYALFFSLCRNIDPSRVEPILVLHDLISDAYAHETLSFTNNELHELLTRATSTLDDIITFEVSEARYWAQHATNIPWPHEKMRPQQERLMNDIKRSCLEDEKRYVLVMAPTGFGKTAAVLHGMLTTGFTKKRRLFILTAKKTQRDEYKKALFMINQKLIKKGSRPIPFLNLEFTSEDCTCEWKIINVPAFIDFKRRQQLIDIMLEQGTIDLSTAENACQYHDQFLVFPACRVIIGDYNHLFLHDLPSRLESSSIPKIDSQTPFLLLIDEIHNLPNRIESGLELRFTPQQLHDILKDLEVAPRLKNTVAPFVRKLWHHVINSRDGYDASNANQIVQTILQGRQVLYQALHVAMKLENTSQPIESLNALLDMVQKLEKILETDPNNVHIEIRDGGENADDSTTKHHVIVSLLHSSDHLKLFWPRFSHVVGMSATIEPLEFYQELLGFPTDETKLLRYSSPFSRGSRLVLVVPTVDTRFSYRWNEAPHIAEEIINIYLSHPARYLVVYPSFRFLELVHKHLAVYRHDIPILSQKSNLTRKKREYFLQELSKRQQAIIQVVSGSIFTEGTNLPFLRGIIIVSPHMLPPTPKRHHLVTYLVNKGIDQKEARMKVYLLPAVSKMIQAAGRLLRHLDDRGVIIFLGKRFILPRIQNIFPPFLKPDAITIDPNPLIKHFWASQNTRSQ